MSAPAPTLAPANHIDSVRQLLNTRLPPEITLPILDLAELWRSSTAARYEYNDGKTQASEPYVSITIENGEKLRGIGFRTESMDQGLAGLTYGMLNEGSGTWLEAVVYRDGERHEGVEIVRNALSRTIWQDRTSWWNGRGVMVGQDYGRSLEWRERRVEEVAGWFRGIETGDVVEVWARAGSGNWVCQVNLVEVTVLYAL